MVKTLSLLSRTIKGIWVQFSLERSALQMKVTLIVWISLYGIYVFSDREPQNIKKKYISFNLIYV